MKFITEQQTKNHSCTPNFPVTGEIVWAWHPRKFKIWWNLRFLASFRGHWYGFTLCTSKGFGVGVMPPPRKCLTQLSPIMQAKYLGTRALNDWHLCKTDIPDYQATATLLPEQKQPWMNSDIGSLTSDLFPLVVGSSDRGEQRWILPSESEEPIR